jgi:F-type H+-transporting ATPase subunit delta
MNHSQAIVARYLMALIAGVPEKEAVELLNSIRTVLIKWQDTPAILDFFCSPAIHRVDKMDRLERVVPESIDPRVKQWFKLLIQNNRLQSIGAVLDDVQDIVDRLSSTQTVIITTAVPIGGAEKDKLIALAKKQVQTESVRPVFNCDKQLVGGFKITIKNWVLDGSVASNLERLKREFV